MSGKGEVVYYHKYNKKQPKGTGKALPFGKGQFFLSLVSPIYWFRTFVYRLVVGEYAATTSY